ncbi:MAG: Holliday junction branch migration protein RuvA [Ignavibacteriales bacterium]|nr:Holliday junction branch migration protein RuvA [Ignavibacteriales bacterium]
MIGYLTGIIISKKPTKLLLDVNGVGYNVNIPINTFEKLGEIGDKVSLFIFLYVKEDALDMYGFFTLSEKEMFELLISVSGIGPKIALSILSGIQIDDLKEALQIGDLSRIVAVPGIGRKTAERLLVELKDKVERITSGQEPISDSSYRIRNDAVTALINLGYNQKLAEKEVRKILEITPKLSIEELIKEVLQIMNR